MIALSNGTSVVVLVGLAMVGRNGITIKLATVRDRILRFGKLDTRSW